MNAGGKRGRHAKVIPSSGSRSVTMASFARPYVKSERSNVADR